MGIKRTTTRAPPAHPKTKRSLTKREVTSYQFPLSDDEIAKLADEVDGNTVGAFLSNVEERARDVLSAAGLPVHMGAVRRVADGRWFDDLPKGWRKKKKPADVLRPGETLVTLLYLAQDRDLHSREQLAAQTLRFAMGARNHMKSGNSVDAVWNAIHLAQTMNLTDYKLNLERPLSAGFKVIVGAHESGKETRSDRQSRDERWRSNALQIHERHPRWSVENICREILKNESPKKNGNSWSRSTVKRAIRKLFKPRD